MNTTTTISPETYLLCVEEATDAKTLRAIRTEIVTDLSLSNQQRSDLSHAIDRRFAQLNAAAVGHQKPRY